MTAARRALGAANLELRDLVDTVRALGASLLTPDEALDVMYGAAVTLLRAQSDLERPAATADGHAESAALELVQEAELLALRTGEALVGAALLTPASDLLFAIHRAVALTDEAWALLTRGEHRPIRPRRAEAR